MTSALTEEQVKEQVTEESYRRGMPYYKRGAVKRARVSGDALRAECEGSRAEPYRVEVGLSEGGVAWARCTCPVGASGECKHTAAVLLAWVHEPDTFMKVMDVDDALATLDRAELEAMARYMVEREPRLEPVLQMRFPTGEIREGVLNPDPYREQARDVFAEHAGGSGAASQVVAGLEPLMRVAQGFEAEGDETAAVEITGAVLDVIVEQSDEVRDEEGFLRELGARCLERIARVLDHEGVGRGTRHDVLARLAALGMSGGALSRIARERMLERESEEERRELALHVRQRLREVAEQEGAPPDSRLLLKLEAPYTDVERYLVRCRALGLHEELVGRLLELGRVEDALEEAKSVDEGVLLELAHAFDGAGQGGAIEELVRERYERSASLELLAWLQGHWTRSGEERLARAAAQARFFRRPELEVYGQLKEMAGSEREWVMERPSLHAHLRERHAWALLVRAHLLDGDVDHALEALQEGRDRGHTSQGWAGIQVEIADVAASTRPRTAIRMYQGVAEGLIEKRNVQAFKDAAQLLARAAAVSRELGEGEKWRTYMDEIESRYGRFQGLREALQAVSLVV